MVSQNLFQKDVWGNLLVKETLNKSCFTDSPTVIDRTLAIFTHEKCVNLNEKRLEDLEGMDKH